MKKWTAMFVVLTTLMRLGFAFGGVETDSVSIEGSSFVKTDDYNVFTTSNRFDGPVEMSFVDVHGTITLGDSVTLASIASIDPPLTNLAISASGGFVFLPIHAGETVAFLSDIHDLMTNVPSGYAELDAYNVFMDDNKFDGSVTIGQDLNILGAGAPTSTNKVSIRASKISLLSPNVTTPYVDGATVEWTVNAGSPIVTGAKYGQVGPAVGSYFYIDQPVSIGNLLSVDGQILTPYNAFQANEVVNFQTMEAYVASSLPDDAEWTVRSAAGNNDYWTGITYGNGLFVAVGSVQGDRVMTSPDGINWTARPAAGNNDSWAEVAYGNGLFVAVGTGPSSDRVMTSPDGINWTVRSAVENDWMGITYGKGIFVAVGNNGQVMTSPNGIDWTERTSPFNGQWSSIAYGNGMFVAFSMAGSDTQAITSPDGINWTSRSLSTGANWKSVAYGNGLFVVLGRQGRMMTSPDGITWTPRNALGPVDDWYALTYGGGLFVAVGAEDGNRVMTSPDGIVWTAQSAAGDNDSWLGITYGDGIFVAVGCGSDYVMTRGRKLGNHNNSEGLTTQMATGGTQIVNFETMAAYVAAHGGTNPDCALKSEYNVFTTSNRFNSTVCLGLFSDDVRPPPVGGAHPNLICVDKYGFVQQMANPNSSLQPSPYDEVVLSTVTATNYLHIKGLDLSSVYSGLIPFDPRYYDSHPIIQKATTVDGVITPLGVEMLTVNMTNGYEWVIRDDDSGEKLLGISNDGSLSTKKMVLEEFAPIVFGGGVNLQQTPSGMYAYYYDADTTMDVSLLQIDADSGCVLHDDNGIWLSKGTATEGLQIVNFQTMNSFVTEATKLTMDDAAGTNCDFMEWKVGGDADQDGNWRMGVVNSNLSIQVKVAGVWVDAASFVRP